MASATVGPGFPSSPRSPLVSYTLMLAGIAIGSLFLWPGLLRNLFDSDFMPHGMCLLWQPKLLWLHIVSDTLIGISYISISLTLAWLVHRARHDIPFSWMFVAFGLFIIACGGTHLLEVLTLWQPYYWISGDVKLMTAIASVATAVALPPLVPKTLDIIRTAKESAAQRVVIQEQNRELAEMAQKLKEADELKTQFFSNVSHELRTPLALILGRTEKLLASRRLGPEQHRELEVVHRNSRMLLKQVNDLLDLAKLEAGRADLEYSDVDVAHFVRRTAANFDSLASDRHVRFVCNAGGSVPAQVDPDKLERVLLNLLSNAFKFTPNGGRISCAMGLDQDDIVIEVADSGPGIPVEVRDVVFERFRQLDGSSTRRFGGSGLGLAIVKDFVQLHGGTVEITDNEGGGAKFVVRIPKSAPEDAKFLPPQVPTEAWQHRAQQVLDELTPARTETAVPNSEVENALASAPLVLVVEDNAEMNRFMVESLAAEYRMATAYGGREGLEKAVALQPDLILADMMMPEVSGEDLLRELRARTEFENVPILLITAKVDREARLQALLAGAQDYIMKPFSVEELRARVGNFVALGRTRRLLQQELNVRTHDVEQLAQEVGVQRRQLYSALEALRASEARFRTLVESNIIGVITAGFDGTVKEANEAFLRMTGYTRDDLAEGKLNWRSMTPPEYVEADVAALQQMNAAGAAVPRKKEYTRKNGTRVPVLVGAAKLEGPPERAVAFVLDLTEQHRSEARVAVQYAVARILAESSTIDDAAPKLLQKVAELLRWDYGEIWTPNETRAQLKCVRTWSSEDVHLPGFEGLTSDLSFGPGEGLPGRVWKTAAPCWLRDFTEEETFVRAPIAKKEGLLSACAFPIILRDEVLGVFSFFSREPQEADQELLELLSGIGNQIGQFIERKRGESAMQELAAIVESSDDAIVGETLEGVITTWNRGAQRIYGYKAEEVIGKPISILSTPERQDEIVEILERLRRGERIQHLETRRKTKEGKEIDVSLSVSVIRNEVGEIVGASTIARDVTDMKRAEQALRNSEKHAMVGHLSAIMAHEINNPLEAVSNVLYLLSMRPSLDDEGQQYVQIATQEVGRIAHIVKQTLGFYREAPLPIMVRIPEIVDDVLTLYSRKMSEKKMSVQRYYDEVGEVPAFPAEIRQVFSNLVINAIEASGTGGVLRIRISATRDWSNPSRCGVRVLIGDTGTGISPEHRRDLFEPFFTTKGEKGTGLGLWVSNGIVQKHGGTIRVHSSTKAGQSGTYFSVFLPSETPGTNQPISYGEKVG